MRDAHKKLIDDLGGPSKLSRLLGESGHHITSQGVSRWATNGVAYHLRHAVHEIANQNQVAIPPDFLTETSKHARRRHG